MILQTSMTSQIRTAAILANCAVGSSKKPYISLMQLSEAYRRFLKTIGQRKKICSAIGPHIVRDAETILELSKLFTNDSLLDDKAQGKIICKKADDDADDKGAKVVTGMKELGLTSKDHHQLLQLISTDVIITPSDLAIGGSTSQALGVIWVNPRPSYSSADIQEMLVHELTHQAMFLDELRYQHYFYENIRNTDTWAQSAILKKIRPLDKVLHSIVVGVEVLLFRKMFIGHPVAPKVHPPTPLLAEQIAGSITSAEKAIERQANCLHPRAVDLIKNCRSILSANFQ